MSTEGSKALGVALTTGLSVKVRALPYRPAIWAVAAPKTQGEGLPHWTALRGLNAL